jgi:hypothetical protein
MSRGARTDAPGAGRQLEHLTDHSRRREMA